ncbi:hypothetical protein IB691_01225 [Fangia hongkongensis]|nr:hypothetical protein [Fangia hongkongensis]
MTKTPILLSIATVFLTQVSFATTNDIDQLVSSMFPLAPKQIKEIKTEVSTRQKAASTVPAMSGTQGVSRVLITSINPTKHITPPNVRLGIGVVTSLIFTDANGNVLPIDGYVIGNSGDFKVGWDKKNNVLMMQAIKPYAETNMAVMLNGLSIPVTITILSTQEQWDYLDYVRVIDSNGRSDSNLTKLDSGVLVDLLHGIVPDGAKKLSISNDALDAWHYQGNYLLVTEGVLISPSWIHHAEDNTTAHMNAYEINPTSVVLVSTNSGLKKVMIRDNNV